jgi:hypothetical protein
LFAANVLPLVREIEESEANSRIAQASLLVAIWLLFARALVAVRTPT